MTKHRLPLAILAFLSIGSALATEAEFKFHPRDGLWSYPLETARRLNGVLVQNTALVNRGSKPITITSIELDVLHNGSVVSSVRIDATTLDAMARQGGALAQSGMMQALDFQFAPKQLLGEGVTVSDTRTLQAGNALLVLQQYVSYRGDADRLRISALLADGDSPVVAELPIRSGTAPGLFHFPLQGRWFIGAAASTHGHHRWAVPEEFALDIMRIGDGGLTYRGKGTRMQHYFGYGAPILAVADGEVVKTHDGEPDNVKMLRGIDESLADYNIRLREGQNALLAAGADAIAGNHVVIQHGNGVFSVYGHLKPGSIKVAKGAKVRVGQHLADLGGSGNSTEPHLHFHLCDAPQPLNCAGMPVSFDNIELPFSDGPRNVHSGDFVESR